MVTTCLPFSMAFLLRETRECLPCRNEPPTAPPLARSTSDVFASLWGSILKLENAFGLHTLPYDRPVVSDAETKLYSGRKYWYESASAHLRPRHTRECTRVCVAAG